MLALTLFTWLAQEAEAPQGETEETANETPSETGEKLEWSSWDGPFGLRALDTVGQPARRGSQEHTVTVHVLLQVHEDPATGEYSSNAKRCQEQIVSTVLKNAAQGADSVIIEGMPLLGEPTKPEVLPESLLAKSYEVDPLYSGSLLGRFKDLKLYGFESSYNQVGGQFIDTHSEQEWLSPYSAGSEWFEQLSLFAGVNVPLRSFEALQTSLLVAFQNKADAVQLIIGRAHWPDFEWAMQRDPRPTYTYVPYVCEL